MKRKLVILLLCLAAAAMLLSASAAESGETSILINGMTTDQLSAALSSNTACRFYLSENYTLDPAPANGILDCPHFNIIDLNGYTLNIGNTSLQINDNFYLVDYSTDMTGKLTGSGSGGSDYVIIVKNGTLTVKEGATVSGNTHGISVSSTGKLDLYGNVSAPTSAVYNQGGTVYVNQKGSVTTTAGSSNDIAIYNDGGTVHADGGSVTTVGTAVYNKNGTLFIHSGSVATTGKNAVYSEGGSVTVDGGEVTAGAEPVIALKGADSYATLTMSGGTVTQTGDGAAVLLVQKAKAEISGGTISAPYTGGADGDGGIGLCLDSTDCELTLSGGTIAAHCCGIYSNDATNVIRLSGNPAFSTGNAANADIELVEWNNNCITIAAPLTYTDRTISVRLGGDENKPGVFTSGYSTHHPNDAPAAFFSTKGGTVILDNGEAKIDNEAYGITVAFDDNTEGTAHAEIYGTTITEAYAGSTVYLAAEPAAGYRLAYWEAVTPEDLIIEDDQFTMPARDTEIQAVFEPVFAVEADANTVVGIIWDDGGREKVEEAGEDDILDIWLSDDARPDTGKYFTGEFTLDGQPLGIEPGYGFIDYFTMPGHDVQVGAVQAEQTPLTLAPGLSPVEVPEAAFDMIAGLENSFAIDIDDSGTDDISLYYDEKAGKCLAVLLWGCDASAGTYPYGQYTGPFDPYSSISFTVPARPRIAGYALRLGGVLGLRCYVELPEGWKNDPAYANARMTFSIPHRKDQQFSLQEAADETVDGKACKRFECSVYAYQMADQVSAVFSYGDGFEASATTTLEEYLKKVRDGADYSDQAKALATAAISYGYYIQPYLARVNGWEYGVTYAPLSDDGVVNVDVDAAASGAETYKYSLTTMGDAVASAQYKLTLNADTIMTIQITLKNAPEEAVTVKVNGEAVTPTVSGTTYTVAISNIAANNLGVGKTVTMEIGGTEAFNLTVSPMSYVYTVLQRSSEPDEQQAMAALYEYYIAADAYSAP